MPGGGSTLRPVSCLSCVVVFCLVIPLTLFILVYAHIWFCSFSCSHLVNLVPSFSVPPDYVHSLQPVFINYLDYLSPVFPISQSRST